MGIGYQAIDRDLIDYDLWFEPEAKIAFRGPRGDFAGSGGIVCIGAAQTFGRFVHRPFPQQIGNLLNQPVLNLGVSGAGPEFYLERPKLMERLERAETVVVQAMSARSVTAGRFRTQPMNKGVLSFVDGNLAGKPYLAQTAYQLLRETEGEDAFTAQVSCVQTRWVEQYRELADRLPERKIFLWLSTKPPEKNVDLTKSPVGNFPHFITAEMVSAIQSMGFELVTCVLEKMEPQVLVNDRTGVVQEVFDRVNFPNRPDSLRALNTYYATPTLHDLASRELSRHILKQD